MRFMWVLLVILCFGYTGVASAGQYDYVEPPAELWSCFDYAMHHSQDNPDWGIVLLSGNPRFKGVANNHYVNYKINDDKILILYGAEDGTICKRVGWEFDTYTFDYYHFYAFDEIPVRRHQYLLPNAEADYNAL